LTPQNSDKQGRHGKQAMEAPAELLDAIRELMLHSRAGSLDADEEENAAYLRAEEVLARYTPAV
jgi:hypothetical protein